MKRYIASALVAVILVVVVCAVLSNRPVDRDDEVPIGKASGADSLEEARVHPQDQPSSKAVARSGLQPAQPDPLGDASSAMGARLVSGENEVLREKHHRLLQALGESEDASFEAVMTRGLGAASPEIRSLALEIHYLTMSESDAIESALLDAEEESDHARLVAARFLAEHGGSEVEADLVSRSRLGDLESQWAFNVALHLRKLPTALEDWAQSASHEADVDVRMGYLLKCLVYPAAATEPLLERAARGEAARERELAARIFRKLHTAEADAWLVTLGRDPDPEVRRAAVGGE